jgi:hypothetical protein
MERAMSWQARAACSGDLSGDWDEQDLTLDCATTCYVCPVRIECFSEAITRSRDSDVGIWGGTTLAQRERIRSGRTTVQQVWQDLETTIKEAHGGGSRDVAVQGCLL